MTFIKRLFTRYTPPSKQRLMSNMFYQGTHGWRDNWWM